MPVHFLLLGAVACDRLSRQDVGTKRSKYIAWVKSKLLTPFASGISEYGSVDMDASSRKTIGNSVSSKVLEPAEIHVVQI